MVVSTELLVAGYGRRRLPHCVTDDKGPEKFAICGRPILCSKDHRARSCGLEFLYDGKIHNKCIKQKTPSSRDPICISLLKYMNKTQIKTKAFVLSEDKRKLLTTCYPTLPRRKSKGWCTVRAELKSYIRVHKYMNL